MPTFLPNPWIKVLQRFQHSLGGDVLSCTYGILGLTGGDLDDLVTSADNVFRARFKPFIDSQVLLLPAWGYQNTTSGDLTLGISTTAAVAGAASITTPPPNVAISIRKRTGFVGRKYRGRMYLPYAVSEANMDELGVINSGSLTAYTTAANGWLTDVAAHVNLEGVYLLHEERATPPQIAPTEVTSCDVGQVVVTQRRRLPRL